MACVRERHPRVVVLDVALEGSHIDGFELCRRLRTEHSDVEVVFYTGVDELGLAERAFAVGAQGVVSKGDSAGRPAQGGAARLARTHLRVAGVRRARRPARLRGPLAQAARRAAAAGAGAGAQAIAEQMGVGEETVKSHLSEVRRKLGARTSAQAVAIGLINSLFEYDCEPASAEAVQAAASSPRGDGGSCPRRPRGPRTS